MAISHLIPMFCEKCKCLLTRDGKNWVCKKCNVEAKPADEKVMREIHQTEIVVLTEELDVLPRMKAECPKCGHNEAFYVLRQTRKSDEPETKIFRCCKCKASWREY
jgi:DNA-directed RNA polymerase subunit M